MLTQEHDLYTLYKTAPSLGFRLRRFVKERGIEMTIAVVGLVIGAATVLVSHKIGTHQEILQASRMTDSYFNGIAELFSKSMDESQRVNLLVIARTDAIISDLNQLNKPDKLASVITFISNLKPGLFYKELEGEFTRDKYIELSRINLHGSNLRNINLNQARLQYSNLSQADLAHTSLESAMLRRTNLKQANLNYTNFKNANLQNANLYNASIYAASFEGANLEGAIWINGIKCKAGSVGQCIY